MPNCASCGTELPDNARFCSNCGKVPLEVQKEQQLRVSPRRTRPPWMGNVPTRWIVIGFIIIIVVASSLGALVAVARSHLNGPTTSLVTPTSHNLCSGQHNTTCSTPRKGKTATTINLVLSGAVNGRFIATRVARCGISGTQYDVFVQGRVDGTRYELQFRITAYSGVGTYNTGQMSTRLIQQPTTITANWVNMGNFPATATINSNIKAGTMDMTVSRLVDTIHITGNWACA